MSAMHYDAFHSIAKLATRINPVARAVERDNDTRIAGCVVLPNYACLFFSDKDTVLKKLKEIAHQH
jgi:hypothetical protein